MVSPESYTTVLGGRSVSAEPAVVCIGAHNIYYKCGSCNHLQSQHIMSCEIHTYMYIRNSRNAGTECV